MAGRDVIVTPFDNVQYIVHPLPLLRGTVPGVLTGAFLTGSLATQCLTYALGKRSRRQLHETIAVILVAILSVMLQIDQWLLLCELVFDGWGNPTPLKYVMNRRTLAFNAMGYGVNAIAQLFFLRRAVILWNRNIPLTIAGLAGVITSLTGGIITNFKMAALDTRNMLTWVLSSRKHKHIVMLNSICAAIIDVGIAIAIIYKIRKAERGFNPQTDSLLVRIAAMTLTTASLSALLAVVAAILAAQLSIDAQLAYISLNLVLPRVNAISLVYSLNARESHSEEANTSSRAGSSGNNRWHVGSLPHSVASSQPTAPMNSMDVDETIHVQLGDMPSSLEKAEKIEKHRKEDWEA